MKSLARSAFFSLLFTGVSYSAVTSFNPVNYGAATAAELDAFNRINAFRADPQNELFDMFVEQGYGGSKATFDALLDGQTSHTGTWWATNFGGNLATWSMDYFGTVPSVLNAQFAALPAAGTLSSYTWNDNLGWSAHRYAVWVEVDAGASPNPHAVAGAPNLSTRLTSAGVNWTSVGENIAPNWPTGAALQHMGFAIDWGPGANGIQNPPGHRNSMLSATYDSVAIGIVDAGWTSGDVSQVQHFVNINNSNPDDPIFYGYATDADTGARLVGVEVEVFDASDVSLGTATTDATGGYTIQYTASGTPAYATYDRDGTIYNTQTLGAPLGNSGDKYFLDASLAIPEPTTAILLVFGGMAGCARRRRA